MKGLWSTILWSLFLFDLPDKDASLFLAATAADMAEVNDACGMWYTDYLAQLYRERLHQTCWGPIPLVTARLEVAFESAIASLWGKKKFGTPDRETDKMEADALNKDDESLTLNTVAKEQKVIDAFLKTLQTKCMLAVKGNTDRPESETDEQVKKFISLVKARRNKPWSQWNESTDHRTMMEFDLYDLVQALKACATDPEAGLAMTFEEWTRLSYGERKLLAKARKEEETEVDTLSMDFCEALFDADEPHPLLQEVFEDAKHNHTKAFDLADHFDLTASPDTNPFNCRSSSTCSKGTRRRTTRDL